LELLPHISFTSKLNKDHRIFEIYGSLGVGKVGGYDFGPSSSFTTSNASSSDKVMGEGSKAKNHILGSQVSFLAIQTFKYDQ